VCLGRVTYIIQAELQLLRRASPTGLQQRQRRSQRLLMEHQAVEPGVSHFSVSTRSVVHSDCRPPSCFLSALMLVL
jgi:hypothetical protein